jgi:hypothetical protein
VKIVSFYDLAPGALAKLKEHFPAHRARLEEFHARGGAPMTPCSACRLAS